MKLETFAYKQNKGWLIPTFPDLDSEQTLVLIFAAPEMINDPTPIQDLARHYPNSKIIGCSSAGEIFGSAIHDNSLSVAVVRFEHTTLKLTSTEIMTMENSFSAGEILANDLKQDDLKGILVLSEGVMVNGSELVRGLNTLENNNVAITGGLAGDGNRFHQTWTILQGKIHQNMAVAVGFYGDYINIHYSSRGGWDIFGPERYITHSKNNVLYELDGQPALKLYKNYLGERASELPGAALLFPLAIRESEEETRHLVRTILGVDENEQSLIFAGDVPTGYLAQLMRANFDRLITSAGEAGEKVGQYKPKKGQEPNLCIAISCVGRRLLLGERTEEEVVAALEGLPLGTQQVGFYSYGELSPDQAGICDFHNQTMTLTTFYENAP